mgnify:CR=1 FL=1
MTGKKIEIISQIVLWYENSFRILIFKLRSLKKNAVVLININTLCRLNLSPKKELLIM